MIAEENEAEARASRWADGDAGEHLEELVVDALPSLLTAEAAASALEIELVGPHLRLQGLVNTGYFRRVSDFLNHKEGLIDLQAATILRRNGDATKVRTPNIWVSPDEVTLIGQNTDPWFHFLARRLKHFFWIGQASRGSPLVIELPAVFDESSAFAKSIRAAEKHDQQMAGIHRRHRAFFHDFRFAICRENQTVSGASGPTGFHSIDTLFSEKLVRVSQKIT